MRPRFGVDLDSIKISLETELTAISQVYHFLLTIQENTIKKTDNHETGPTFFYRPEEAHGYLG